MRVAFISTFTSDDGFHAARRVEQYVRLIEPDVARDTRKHATTAAFRTGIFGAEGALPNAGTPKGFAELRRAAQLSHPAVVDARKP